MYHYYLKFKFILHIANILDGIIWNFDNAKLY
jgi:hypothetical protein